MRGDPFTENDFQCTVCGQVREGIILYRNELKPGGWCGASIRQGVYGCWHCMGLAMSRVWGMAVRSGKVVPPKAGEGRGYTRNQKGVGNPLERWVPLWRRDLIPKS